MVITLALAAALLYGSADFLGGAATRKAHVLSVLAVSAPAGVAVVLTAALLAGEPARAAGVWWGIAAGICGGIGLMFFYAGLAAGPMSVVAPVSALVSTVLPFGAALAAGERPGGLVYAGIAACLAAIVLVSSGGGAATEGPGAPSPRGVPSPPEARPARGRPGQGSHRGQARGVAWGMLSGAAFGLFFLFIRNGGESGAFWPIAVARMAGATVVLAAAVAARRRPVRWKAGPATFLPAAGSGIVDASANICYVLATRAGLFGLAIVLTSLYPAVTVLLARAVFGERARPVQGAGLALALIGILLVTV